MIIFHITSRYQWERSKDSGVYEAPSLHFEGFIHCSRANQLERTANEFFKGENDLVLLCIDTEKVRWEIRWENLEGGSDLFPHIYGPVDGDAVVKVLKFDHDSEGFFHLPPGLTVWAEGAYGVPAPRKTGPLPAQGAPTSIREVESPSPFTVPIADTSPVEPEFVASLPHEEPPFHEIEALDQLYQPPEMRRVKTAQPHKAENITLPARPIPLAAWAAVGLAAASGVAVAFQPGTLAQAAVGLGLDRGNHGALAALGLFLFALSLAFSGWLAEKISPRILTAAGAIAMALGSGLMMGNLLVLLFLGQIIFSIGAGAAVSGVLGWLSGFSPSSRIFSLTGIGIAALLFPCGFAGLIQLSSRLLLGWTGFLAVAALVLAVLNRSVFAEMTLRGEGTRSGKFLAGIFAGLALMLGAVCGALSILPSFPATQTAGIPFLVAAAAGFILLALASIGGGALADWMGRKFQRWGRSDLAGAVLAFAGCVIIPVGMSVMVLGASAFNTAFGYGLVCLGGGAAAAGITGLSFTVVPGWPRAFLFGVLAAAAVSGAWIALAVGGLLGFAQAANWINLAMVCALIALAGSVVAMIHLALKSPATDMFR